jgi:hypothetical protein
MRGFPLGERMSVFLAVPLSWLDDLEADARSPQPHGVRRAGSAMIWLARRVCVSSGWEDLERGQLSFSARDLANAMHWSPTTAGRFIQRLLSESDLFLVQKNPNGKSVFQVGGALEASVFVGGKKPRRRKAWTASGAPSGQRAGEAVNTGLQAAEGSERVPETSTSRETGQSVDSNVDALLIRNARSIRSVLTTYSPRPHPAPSAEGLFGAEWLQSEGEGSLQVSPVEAVEAWNRMAATVQGAGGSVPTARLTPTRERMLRVRLKEPSWWSDFQDALGFVASEPWTHGLGPVRKQGMRPWCVDLDWLLQPGHATRFAERQRAKALQGNRVDPVSAQDPWYAQFQAFGATSA